MRLLNCLVPCMLICSLSIVHAHDCKAFSEPRATRFIWPPNYASYADVAAILEDLAEDNPEIAYMFTIGKTYEGFELWVLRLTDNVNQDVPNQKPAVFFNCQLHGRERIPVQVGLAFAQYICDHKADPDVAGYLQNLDIYILPMCNPDAIDVNGCCQSSSCWRKDVEEFHERGFESPVPANGSGVDLNRSWDFQWDGIGGAKILQSQEFRGQQPILDYETQCIRRFMNSRPTLAASIDWHSARGAVYYKWDGTYDSVDNAYHRNVIMAISQEMANILGYVSEEGNHSYLSAGDSTDAHEAVEGIISFTIETKWDVFGLKPYVTCLKFDPPYPSDEVQEDIDNNIQAGLYLLEVVQNNPYMMY